ncbi:MAG TPA: arginase, partial [Chloroflexota bacterium]|nr:arginase [Chloroflexota bacterium]
MASRSGSPTVEIVGVPLDLGAGHRGVDMGPSAIRYAGLNDGLSQLGIRYRDHGNLTVPVAEELSEGDRRARYSSAVGDVCRQLRDSVVGMVERASIPLILGGDHSLAIGSLAGLLSVRPNTRVIWVDAHGDGNTPHTSPSGNVHGMPLGVALGEATGLFDSLGWDRLRLPPQNIVLLGVRDLDPDEKAMVRRRGLCVYTMEQIDRVGLRQTVQEALDRLDPGPGELHVSFDADVVDPLYAPGVGTPVAGGLTYREAHAVM